MTYDLVIIYTTTPDLTSANNLAKSAVEAKLAACANIISQGTSVYMDEGKLQSTTEFYVLLKTLKHKEVQLKELIQKIHPYQTPCIISFNAYANDKYKSWLLEVIEDS